MTEFAYIALAFGYAVLTLYVLMIAYAVKGWKQIPRTDESESNESVSILIAARNEHQNIETVVRDVMAQNYPKHQFELIVIDDNSEDETFDIANQLKAEFPNLSVITNEVGKGKKAALQSGINNAKHPILVTVDADCRVPSEWLTTMLSHWKTGTTKMLLGPIVLEPANTVFERVQALEMHAIMGLTGGFAAHKKPIMANGANLFFDKAAFSETGGYSNNANPSGDDVFTMLNFSEKWPESVQFVKDYEAAVLTRPQSNFSDFWQQRKRWMSKNAEYSNWLVKSTALITFLANAATFASLIFIVTALASYWTDKLMWILFIKTLADLIITRNVSRDLQPYCGIANILVTEVFVSFYVTILGVFGNFGGYRWKGRSID